MLELSPAGRRYGALPDSHSPYDQRYYQDQAAQLPIHLVPRWPFLARSTEHVVKDDGYLNKIIDLEPWAGPKKNQANLGCCTGFAWSGYAEYLARRIHKQDPVLSPLFVYWLERMKEGTLGQDSGAQMRTGAQVLNQYGVCLEAEDPYAPSKFTIAPSNDQYTEALKWKGGAYHRLMGSSDMRSCLVSGYPVAIGITVYESFESDYTANTGIVPMPKSGEKVLGGHAVLVIGLDDTRGVYKVRNSWSESWGDKGNFYLPYEFVSLGYAYDRWMIHLGRAWK